VSLRDRALLHFVFESLGYAAAAAVYLVYRRRRGDALPDADRIWTIVAAAAGAAVGSRALFLTIDPARTLRHVGEWSLLSGGKTIVGALLGGLIAVELVKRFRGITVATGDLYVPALAAGIAVGRIGCFLAGPMDHTAGLPTSLPWGIASGDAVRRHPTALYEIAFVLLLAFALRRVPEKAPAGAAFALFLAGYLAFRFAVDFLKPEPPPLVLGLTGIQLACLAGLGYYAAIIPKRLRPSRPIPLPAR
jgi:prolipoprotein diacylglyceryltransferase